MKPTRMTLAEFFAWNGKGGAKGLEEYKKLLTRMHWLSGRLGGQRLKLYEAMDSMSVFSEDEHDDPLYLKYQKKHDECQMKINRYLEQMDEVESLLLQHMKEG